MEKFELIVWIRKLIQENKLWKFYKSKEWMELKEKILVERCTIFGGSFNRGFPKELYDGHWCYLLKHCGTKLLVIPTTSIKESSSTDEQDYYFDIEETDNCQSRLRFDEIRMIDKMRVVTKDKPYRDVKTDRKIIEEKFMNFLKLSIFPIDSEEK